MTVSVSTIAERALRRLNVTVVPLDDRPTLTEMVPVATIATMALVELGVIATDHVPPSQGTVVTVDAIADNALVRLGVIATGGVPPSQTAVVPLDTVATLALTKLGVIASDETPATTDLDLARAAVTAVHNALVAQGIADWTSAAITTEVSEEYAGLTAAHLAPSFGKASDPTMVPMLEARIATTSRVSRAHALAQTAVLAIHASLVAQGSADWTSAGITTAVSEEYAGLTAAHIASSFGKESDPALVPVLEARVATTARVKRAYALALDKVASVHAALDAQGLVWWDGTAVPRAFVEEYAKLTAAQAASSFGQKIDPADVATLEGRVRRGVMGIASHDIAVEAVMGVHNDLAGKGIARWSSLDIPDMAAMPYEMLAAYELAPKFPPAEQDKTEAAQAMRTLFIITALPSSGERVRAEYF